MKSLLLLAGAVATTTAPFAQTTTGSADAHATEVAQLTAQKQLLTLQKEIAEVENALRTAQGKQLSELADGLAKITKPTGDYKLSADGAASPASTLQIAKLLQKLAEETASEIASVCNGSGYVLAPATGFEVYSSTRLAVFKATAADHLKQANWLHRLLYTLASDPNSQDTSLPRLKKELDEWDRGQEAVTGAEVALAAPVILSSLAGFFRAEATERTFDAGVADGTATALVVQHLVAKSKPVWNSPTAYLASLVTGSPSDSEIFTTYLTPIQNQGAKLAYAAIFIDQDVARLETTKKTAETALKESNTQLATLREAQLMEKPPTADATPAELEHLKVLRDYRDKRIEELATKEVPSREAEVARLASLHNGLSALAAKLKAHLAKTDAFFATLAAKDGEVPLVIALLREQAFLKVTAQPRQIHVKVAVDLGSTVARKRFLSTNHYANAVLALEYHVASFDGKLLRSGVLHKGIAEALPKPGDLNTFTWDNPPKQK